MVNVVKAAPETLTVAYAYGDRDAVVLAYSQSSSEAARRIVEGGTVGGQPVSDKVKSKLDSMIANFAHAPEWRGLRPMMTDPKFLKRTGGRRGH